MQLGKNKLSLNSLQAWLDHQRNQKSPSGKRSNKMEDKDPTAFYINVHLAVQYPNIDSAINILNMDLWKQNIQVQKKNIQCWNSAAKRLLISVHTGLCQKGAQSTTAHRLKLIEKVSVVMDVVISTGTMLLYAILPHRSVPSKNIQCRRTSQSTPSLSF